MRLTREQVAKIQGDKHYRSFSMQLEKDASIDEEARTVEIAFSSEDPYMRWFGWEILGHEKGEFDLEWLNSGAAPLLLQHNHSQQIGVIEKAWIDKDRKGRAVVRFGKGALASEIFQDVIDGIRKNISVGYEIVAMKLIEEDEEKGDTYRISWRPFEDSIVSVPADKTVGVGRSAEEQLITQAKGKNTMGDENKEKKGIDEQALRAKLQQKFEQETRDIMAIGEKHGFTEKAMEFISNGKSPEEFRNFVLEELGKRGMKPATTKDIEIGMSDKEADQFSFVRAINALANPNNKKALDAAGFEYEASRAVAEKTGQAARGILVPLEVQKREVTVGGTGGNLVATNLMGGSFIELQRAKMLVFKLGARVLSGLVGDLAIPRQTGGAVTYWVGESEDGTESTPTYDQVTMNPKTQASRVAISRKMLLQSSPDVESLTRDDIAKAHALGVDFVSIAGSGSGAQPRGILNTNGVGAVIGGDNGAAPTWDHIVALWSAVAQDNADVGALGFLTNPLVVGKLMTTEKAANTAKFIIENFPDKDGFTNLAGSRCGVSTQVPADLDKGTAVGICSAAAFGNWSDLIIGQWGSLDIVVDGISPNDGSVIVKAYQDVDVAVRHPDSFSIFADILPQ